MDEYEEVDADALARLAASNDLEAMVDPDLTSSDRAEKILQDAAPMVAAGLVNLALKSGNPSIQLRASTYLLDRVLGKSGDGPTKAAPWESIYDAITVGSSPSK